MTDYLPHTDHATLNAPAEWWAKLCQPEGNYAGAVDASDPVQAIRTWETVTIVAHGTAGRHGEVRRRNRSASVNARKHAIENAPWTDSAGSPMSVRLELKSKRYSETYGFMHASYFTYRIIRNGG